MKNIIKKSLLVFVILGILFYLPACGAMNKFAHSGPGKALYYGLNAVRNPVGTAVALTAGAAAGFSAAKTKHTLKAEPKDTYEETSGNNAELENAQE